MSGPCRHAQRAQSNLFTLASNVAALALADVLVLFLAAYVAFVGFNNLVRSTKRAGEFAIAHCLANAVHHEPR